MPPDEATARAFLAVIHAQARRALNNAPRPGVLQVVRVHPSSPGASSQRFKIGDLDGMAAAVLADAAVGHNVYIEARTVAEDARGRGEAKDTRGVFAFVVDDDPDKGKGARLAVEPSLVVETSPGNRHLWFFLDSALTHQDAEPIGDAIRAATGGDADTGVITQPYRVAGTPNYPNAKKLARGRVETPTRLLAHTGKLWTRDELWAAFPAQPKPEPRRYTGHATGSGTDPFGFGRAEVEEIASAPATAEMDRSARFHSAVLKARRAGMSPAEVEEIMRRHPHGCASKWLEGRDRLRHQIEWSWTKPESDPRLRWIKLPHDRGAVPVEEARRTLSRALAEAFRRRA